MSYLWNSSPCGTRLRNILHEADLEVEDFAVLDPHLIRYYRNCGSKTIQALEERLDELGFLPGEYIGPTSIRYSGVIDYYKAHKAEICKANPVRYNAKHKEPEKPKDDWQTFRREAAKDAMCAILSNSKMVDERSWDYVISVVKNAVGYADELITSLQQEQPEVDLEKAARNVYESWMGGTMDDVRRDMVELGKVLIARKE